MMLFVIHWFREICYLTYFYFFSVWLLENSKRLKWLYPTSISQVAVASKAQSLHTAVKPAWSLLLVVAMPSDCTLAVREKAPGELGNRWAGHLHVCGLDARLASSLPALPAATPPKLTDFRD